MRVFIENWEALLWSVGILVGAVALGLLAHHLLFRIIRQLARRTATVLDEAVDRHCRKPIRLIMPLVAVRIAVPFLPYPLPPRLLDDMGLLVSITLIVAVAWLLIRFTSVLEDFVLERYRLDVKDNLAARKIYTQVDIIRKILVFVIGVITLAAVLLNFEGFRQLGTSILASAGLAGLIIGLSAQKTLANLLAGIQIAITQPIRLDDVVIVENEWGRVEEITLTYVVVAIWDLRRLVLPISYFLERPFQNWTRVSADILGSVFLHVDYTIPIEAVRAELHRILAASRYWDGKVWRLHTTDAREQTVELRALMSARNSGDAWELRCEVREKLIEFVRQHYPHSLPRVRAEIQNRAPQAPSGGVPAMGGAG